MKKKLILGMCLIAGVTLMSGCTDSAKKEEANQGSLSTSEVLDDTDDEDVSSESDDKDSIEEKDDDNEEANDSEDEDNKNVVADASNVKIKEYISESFGENTKLVESEFIKSFEKINTLVKNTPDYANFQVDDDNMKKSDVDLLSENYIEKSEDSEYVSFNIYAGSNIDEEGNYIEAKEELKSYSSSIIFSEGKLMEELDLTLNISSDNIFISEEIFNLINGFEGSINKEKLIDTIKKEVELINSEEIRNSINLGASMENYRLVEIGDIIDNNIEVSIRVRNILV